MSRLFLIFYVSHAKTIIITISNVLSVRVDACIANMTSSFRHWKKESESFEETNLKQILKMKIILKNNFKIQNKGASENIPVKTGR